MSILNSKEVIASIAVNENEDSAFTPIPSAFFSEYLHALDGDQLKVFLVICYQVFTQRGPAAISYQDFHSLTRLNTLKISTALKRLKEIDLIETGRAGLSIIYYPILPRQTEPLISDLYEINESLDLGRGLFDGSTYSFAKSEENNAS